MSSVPQITLTQQWRMTHELDARITELSQY